MITKSISLAQLVFHDAASGALLSWIRVTSPIGIAILEDVECDVDTAISAMSVGQKVARGMSGEDEPLWPLWVAVSRDGDMVVVASMNEATAIHKVKMGFNCHQREMLNVTHPSKPAFP